MTTPLSTTEWGLGIAPLELEPSLNEISGLIRKRLAWYGLDHLNLRRLEIAADGDIVAELADSRATTTYEEVFDRRTGSLRSRIARPFKAA